MSLSDHRKARARVGIALAAGIALATVAVPAPAAIAAGSAALEEYVLTPPGISRQEIPTPQGTQAGEGPPAERPGVLAPAQTGQDPIAAAIGGVAQIPPALLVSSAIFAACLLIGLIASRRERVSIR